MHNGRVSLVAKDATRPADSHRVGAGRPDENRERRAHSRRTADARAHRTCPRMQALDLLLRSVSGYLAAPRPTMIANASRFDRIVVMPTIAAPASSRWRRRRRRPSTRRRASNDDDRDDDQPAPNVRAGAECARSGVQYVPAAAASSTRSSRPSARRACLRCRSRSSPAASLPPPQACRRCRPGPCRRPA